MNFHVMSPMDLIARAIISHRVPKRICAQKSLIIPCSADRRYSN